MQRRDFLGTLAAGAAIAAAAGEAARRRPPQAIAFDALVLFDVRTVAAAVRQALGTAAGGFAAAWLQRLFADTWLLTAAGRYQAFEAVAAASLLATAQAAGRALPEQAQSALLAAFAGLDLCPDVRPALKQLHDAGIRLSILSNFSADLLNANLQRSGLQGAFEAVLSTDRVRSFKPAPRAYAMAPEALGLAATEIGFAAFGGWDALGATWFGFRTAWVNRNGAAPEWLDATPEVVSSGIEGVLTLAGLN